MRKGHFFLLESRFTNVTMLPDIIGSNSLCKDSLQESVKLGLRFYYWEFYYM